MARPKTHDNKTVQVRHGAYTNGSCQVWSDDQCECIWNDVLENQKRFGLHTQTEQTIITRGSGSRYGRLVGLLSLVDGILHNRGRSWEEDDLNVGIYRPNCILCVFNVDLLPFEDKSRGHTKQDELVDPNLLEHR